MKYIAICFLGIIHFWSCSSPQKQQKVEVAKLETELNKGYSKEKADKLNKQYLAYIEKFPEDSTSREYMLRGLETAIIKNDPAQAVQFIDMFLSRYPADAKAPAVQFKKGVVYELLYGDPIGAIAQYELVIKNYPDSKERTEAENAILLLKDPEAFLKTVVKDGNADSLKAESLK